MIRNVLPLACMVSFHALEAVILMLLSTGSAKSVSLPFYRNRSLELFYLYPDNAPTIMFSIFSDIEISEMLIPRNIYFFEHAVLKNMTVCSVWYFSIPVFYYSILSTKYHMIDLEVFSWSSLLVSLQHLFQPELQLESFKRLSFNKSLRLNRII